MCRVQQVNFSIYRALLQERRRTIVQLLFLPAPRLNNNTSVSIPTQHHHSTFNQQEKVQQAAPLQIKPTP